MRENRYLIRDAIKISDPFEASQLRKFLQDS